MPTKYYVNPDGNVSYEILNDEDEVVESGGLVDAGSVEVAEQDYLDAIQDIEDSAAQYIVDENARLDAYHTAMETILTAAQTSLINGVPLTAEQAAVILGTWEGPA